MIELTLSLIEQVVRGKDAGKLLDACATCGCGDPDNDHPDEEFEESEAKFKKGARVVMKTEHDAKGVIKKVIPPGKEYNRSDVNKYLVLHDTPPPNSAGGSYSMYYDEDELRAAYKRGQNG